jgi:predicted patatin/cPLA2 family phospholipase
MTTPLRVAAGPHVAEAVLQRASERASSPHATSPLKVALVVQGGTLRSVASCGAAAALNALGLTNAFDTVYGASSGSVNAAYFLSAQAALGVSVYLDDVNNRRFLNFLRLNKMIDLEFFFDEIVMERKKHNLTALRSHPTELKILTVDLIAEAAHWFSSKDTELDVYAALKASCALPLIYGRGVPVGPYRCIDGYVVEPMPLLTPLAGDYTHILVLLTRHVSVRQKPGSDGILGRLVDALIGREIGPKLNEQYRNRWKRYNLAADAISAGCFVHPDGRRTEIAFACPTPDAEAHRFEKRRDRLADAAYSSWRATFELFGKTSGADRASFDQAVKDAIELNASRLSNG